MNAAPTFTASQIAAALGRRRQAIQRSLKSVAPNAQRLVGGNMASAWFITSLPSELQSALQSVAIRKGYRNTEHLLSSPPERWEPPFPLSGIAEHCIARAASLQRAFIGTIARLNDSRLTEAEFAKLGVEDYRAEFSHPISTRHWRRLFERIIERDGGAENFARLELYLSDQVARKGSGATAVQSSASIEKLDSFIAYLPDPVEPTAKQKTLFWNNVCEHYSQAIAEGRAASTVKNELLDYICAKAPFAAPARQANAKQLRRKLNQWIEGGFTALKDKRGESSGFFRGPQISEEDRDTLLAAAVLKHGSRVAPALRECIRKGELSPELVNYYAGKNANKSAIPPRIRDAVLPQAKAMVDIHHGPRRAKLVGPHISRDWSDVHSMDFWQADDATLPVYYYETGEDGSVELMRGQLLLFIDLRSLFILGFTLLSSRNYNALAIRRTLIKLCDQWGMPRGLYFENGIWRKARILMGDSRAGQVRPWEESEIGLREHFEVIHAQLPRAKPIERVIGAIQDLMFSEPCYAGRNEILEKFERTQKDMRAVKSGKLNPEGQFYTASQWAERLQELFGQYNRDPQQGKMLKGLSPADAFHQFRNVDDPPTRLDARCRHTLSNHQKIVRVTSKGICMEFGGEQFRYFDRKTGALIGREVKVGWDPELPQVITVADIDGENPFIVDRALEVPAINGGDRLTTEQQRGAAHMAPIKEQYRSLRNKHPLQFRTLLVDRATADLGAAITTRASEMVEARKQNDRKMAEGQKVARDLGITIRPEAIKRPGQIEALTRLAARLAKAPSKQEQTSE